MVFRIVYELIAEHAQLLEHHFCDLKIAAVTKNQLVGASSFFNLLVSLNIIFTHFVTS